MPDISLKEGEKQKLEIITSVLNKKTTNGEAAKKLGLSIRQIQRLKIEVTNHGSEAVIHHLRGKPSNHLLHQAIKAEVLGLVKEKYSDFKPTFASEKLQENHQLIIHPETLRLWMIEENLWKVKQYKHPEYHAWRERKDYYGELEQFVVHIISGLKKDYLMSWASQWKYVYWPQLMMLQERLPMPILNSMKE